jgi:hypothetical protein
MSQIQLAIPEGVRFADLKLTFEQGDVSFDWTPIGRPRKLNSEQEQLARRLIGGEGKPVSEVSKTFNVHAATIRRLS